MESLDGLFESSESACLGCIGTPGRATANAPIFTGGMLQAAQAAIRAETAVVEPIAVRIKGVFGFAFADLYAVARREDISSVIPSGSLHAQKIDVHRIGGVGKQGMG